MIERIANLDPDMFKLVLEDRAQARPEAKKYKPEQFFDDSVVKELEKEGFSKRYLRGEVENQRSIGLVR